MQKRIVSEKVAKFFIYFFMVVALSAVVFLFWDAHTFYAASPPSSMSQPQDSSAYGTLPRVQTNGTDASSETTDNELATADISIPPFSYPDVTTSDAEQAETVFSNVPIDDTALQSEIARIAAMGYEIPTGMHPQYFGEFHSTAYCCEVYPHICGGNGITASGTVPTPGLTVATDWSVLPPGTWIYIADVGIRRVEDSGSAIISRRLDIAIDTHENALRWPGFGGHEVWVLAWPPEDA